MDNKKEILTESTLLKFKNLAIVIAIPDLLTPGINEMAWKKPIITADFVSKLLSRFFTFFCLSEKYNKTPNNKVVHPITLMVLKSFIIPFCEIK